MMILTMNINHQCNSLALGISSFFVTIIKCHDQGQLMKQFSLAYDSGGKRVHHGGKV